MRKKPQIPGAIEDYRDWRWRREGMRQVQSAFEAERFIEQVGFAACLTDCRRPGPSLYVAVCGRRDAVMPRNVQKDEEASLTWTLKDEIVRRGNVYYAKLARGKATFLAPRMATHGVTTPRAYVSDMRRYNCTEQAPQIACPSLITDNETDLVSTGQGQELFDALTCPKTFRRFLLKEGAEGHCEGMGQIVFWTAAFDWIEQTLG